MSRAPDRRERIHQRAIEGVENVFPLKVRDLHVEVRNAHVVPKQFSSREQKEAILHGRTLQEPLRGDLVLRDAAGKTIETQKDVTLAQIPFFTPRHTFIVEGNEYTVSNQRRVRPGVYTRVRGNDELEAAFNLAKGENFKINMSPEKGHLYVQYGSSKIPLYPVLRSLGVTDTQLKKSWGEGVVDLNQKAFARQQDGAIRRLYERIVPAHRRTATTPETMARDVAEAYRGTVLDADVTTRTLGKGYAQVTPDAMLRASQKLLDVHRAGVDTDDRDSLAFQTLHGVEDFFKERIQLEGRNLARKVGVKASGQVTPTLAKVIPVSPFTRSLRSFVTNANLSAIPTQINPVEILDSAVRITSLGEGGIGSERAVPPEARNLHSTHLGIIDPSRTAECYVEDMEVFTSLGWKRWPNITEKDWLACRIDERLEFHRPTHLVAQDYQGPIYGVKTGKISYAVTPNHRVWCRYEENSHWRIQRADEIHGAWSRCFDTGHAAYLGEPIDEFQLPEVSALPKNQHPEHGGYLTCNLINVGPIKMRDWAAFMGWYLSEGNVTYDEVYPTYRVDISQSREQNPANCEMIEALLNRLPFKWSEAKGNRFYIGVKQLAAYLKDFGYCQDKYIPDYFFQTATDVREILLETLLLGDGRIDSHRKTGRSYRERVFCTTSPRLAIDFERLAISLGHATRTSQRVDKREERYLDTYEVRILQHRYRYARRYGHAYFVEQYTGRVYCAEVPGGLLYVRRQGSVPIWCGNSFKAGVDLRATVSMFRDEDGRMYTKLRNARTGKIQDVPVDKLETSIIAFPGEIARGKPQIGALRYGYVTGVAKKDVDYEVIHPSMMYSPTTNLVPMPESLQGNRTIMGSKMATQALPLIYREAPYVQVAHAVDGRSMEDVMADQITPTAPVSGIIKKIDGDYIYIQPERTKKGEEKVAEWTLFPDQEHVDIEMDMTKEGAAPLVKVHYDDNYPLASKTYLHNDVTVKAGDRVTKGQQLATSNFTKDGTLALGKNLRVGYMAYYGDNSNDAVVISEAASKKLTSEHMYKEMLQLDNDVMLGKSKYRAQFPNRWTAAQYDNLDAQGVAKSGATVNPGDPLIIALRRIAPTAEMMMLGKLHRTLAKPFREETVVWNHKAPGTIIDVVVTGSRALVTVKTQETAGVGDKISGRYGNKGVISKIIPDDQMIQTGDGKPIDILMTSAGIVSRVNPAQIIETAVAKVAEKTGERILIPSMSGRNNVQWAKDLLKQHGISDKEHVYNPRTGRMVEGPDGKGIMVGPQYIYKLFKSTDTNYSARGVEDYDVNLQPAKGGEEGAKGLGRMEIHALLAHNARNVLQEASTLKSTRNDEFWRAYQLGQPLPQPKASFAYDKFSHMLTGAGIKFDKSDDQLRFGPLTDGDIKKMSSGAIAKGTMIRERDLKPERGGLFDPVITGGTQGTRWSHVDLREPIVNPTFEDPVRRLLGFTQKAFRQTLADEGGTGLQKRLRDLDVEAKKKELRELIETATGAKLDNALKQWKYLDALQRENLRPDEAYVLSKLPVVPPVVRPIMPSRGKRDLLVSDANYLYRDAILANDALQDVKATALPKEIGKARLQLYDSASALFGMADPTSPQLQGRKAQGFISTIAGQGSPKGGFFHGKLLRLPQDLSGRGTIVPDLTLGMDQVGLPEEMLWKTFQPHIIRSLVQKGYKAVDAQRMIEEHHPVAREAMVSETQRRPVLVNRAPTLHRYGILGAYATPVPGKTIRINPFMETGLSADYDGDTLQIHVPVSDKAVNEVKSTTLSNLLFGDRGKNDLMVMPQHEAVLGIYAASQAKGGTTHKFKSEKEALEAYRRGEISLKDSVRIG
jgi:DNA-directed RNA polymerase beta subunit